MAKVTKPVVLTDGQVPTAANFNADFDTLYTEFNGNITDENIKGTAAIDGQKIKDSSIPASKFVAGAAMPPGGVISFAGSTVPTGWLLCDGTAVSRTVYGNLFTAIGTTYGTGDGSATFNLPNLKSRVPVGQNAGDTSFATLGQTGGENTHTLSAAEMPVHSHGVSDPGHAHGSGAGPIGNFLQTQQPFNPTEVAPKATDASGTGISIQNAGSGLAHNNLQQYITLNYIIKT